MDFDYSTALQGCWPNTPAPCQGIDSLKAERNDERPHRLQTDLSALSIYKLLSRRYAELPAPPAAVRCQCVHGMLSAFPASLVIRATALVALVPTKPRVTRRRQVELFTAGCQDIWQQYKSVQALVAAQLSSSTGRAGAGARDQSRVDARLSAITVSDESRSEQSTRYRNKWAEPRLQFL